MCSNDVQQCYRRLNQSVCRHFRARRKGLGPGLRTTGGRDGIFSIFVPRTYPYNPASRHVQEHAKIQLRLGVALEWTPEKRARDDRAEKYGGKRGVGGAVGLVGIRGRDRRSTRGLQPELYDVAPRGAGEGGRRTIGELVRDRSLVCIFADSGGIVTSCKEHKLMPAFSTISISLEGHPSPRRPGPIIPASFRNNRLNKDLCQRSKVRLFQRLT